MNSGSGPAWSNGLEHYECSPEPPEVTAARAARLADHERAAATRKMAYPRCWALYRRLAAVSMALHGGGYTALVSVRESILRASGLTMCLYHIATPEATEPDAAIAARFESVIAAIESAAANRRRGMTVGDVENLFAGIVSPDPVAI